MNDFLGNPAAPSPGYNNCGPQPVTLVTSEPGAKTGKNRKSGGQSFGDVSRLYAKEIGPMLYRFIVQPNLHDRWAVFDDKRIYSLGGSAKDAGDKLFGISQ